MSVVYVNSAVIIHREFNIKSIKICPTKFTKHNRDTGPWVLGVEAARWLNNVTDQNIELNTDHSQPAQTASASTSMVYPREHKISGILR